MDWWCRASETEIGHGIFCSGGRVNGVHAGVDTPGYRPTGDFTEWSIGLRGRLCALTRLTVFSGDSLAPGRVWRIEGPNDLASAL
jgi:hypothetical protein